MSTTPTNAPVDTGAPKMQTYDPIEYFAQGGSGLGTMNPCFDGDWARLEDAQAAISSLEARALAAEGKVAAADNALDMFRDEFQRIAAIGRGKADSTWAEVAGLCERAINGIESRVPLIKQIERVQAELLEYRNAVSLIDEVYGNPNSTPESLVKDLLQYNANLIAAKKEDLISPSEENVNYWTQRIMDETEEVFTTARIAQVIRELLSADTLYAANDRSIEEMGETIGELRLQVSALLFQLKEADEKAYESTKEPGEGKV